MSDVLVEELETLEILEVAVQGPPGPAGSSGSQPGKTLAYTGSKLTEVFIYSDPAKTTLVERRVLNYTGDTLATIQSYNGTGSLTKTRTFTYSGGALTGYSDA